MERTALYIYSLVVGILLMACSEDGEANGTDLKVATVVRIQTTLDLGGSMSSTRSLTKAAGETEDGNTDYSEGKEPGNNAENKVSTARLVAVNPQSGTIAKNILYRLPGETLGAGEKEFAFDYDPSIGKMKLNLDMQIMSGSYLFVLITNEEASWNLGAVTSYSSLLSTAGNFLNPIVKVDDLDEKVVNKSGIPMIGQAAILVKANSNAMAENPQIINDPIIELERTIAKVEVSIRNTDDGANVIETAKPYQIKSATLFNGNQRYNLFKENNAAVTEDYSDYVSAVTHTAGALFMKQNIFTGYIAERKGITEDKATKVRIVVAANGNDYEYDIPLFQYEDADKTKKNYDIRRNTIYRLGTRLVGKELSYELEVYTAVEGWKTETIGVLELPPVDFLNLDTKTVYLGTNLTGNHVENIYYSSNLVYMGFEADGIAGANVDDQSEYLEVTIPKNSFKAGDNKPLKLIYGKNGKIVLYVTIMVKAIDRPELN